MVKKIQEFDVIQFYLNHLQFSNVSTDTTVILKEKTAVSFCSATYYGKTKHHFKIRMCEHLGVSALTGKRVKGDNDSAIKEHHLFCNYSSGFDDFCILTTNNNNFKVTLMESLLINRDHPPLNKNRHSLPLELFDD